MASLEAVNLAGIGRVLLAGLVMLTGIGVCAISLYYSDDAVCALINAGLFLLPVLLLSTVRGRLPTAMAAAMALAVLIWGIGEFKLHFFGNRLALMDFVFLSEGANWGIVKRYPRVQLALAAWLLLTALLFVWAALENRRRGPLSPRARALSALLLAGWCAVAWGGRHQHTWEVFRDDADCGREKICGVMSRLVYSYSAFEFITPLPGGDPVPFMTRAAQLPAPAVVAAPARAPDVVIWLHESSFDPDQYQLYKPRLPKMGMFQRNRHTRARGQLRVHTYGGKTWLSEFSLLTGLVPADFGSRSSLVFNSVAPLVNSTLVDRFEAAGYDSVALLPTPKRFYGAARTYGAIGFDRILTLRDFPEYDALPGDEWDIADSDRMAEAAITLLRAQRATQPQRPLLLYLLSIKEHSPYDRRTPVAYGLDQAGIPRSLAAKLTDYVDRLRRLDDATTRLGTELAQQALPALWAYFGDHQAYFEEAQPAYRHTHPDPHLITQYQIRTNYAVTAPESPELLDIALLPSLIADLAGVAPDRAFSAHSTMRRLCAGRLRDCPDTALLESYQGHLFGAQIGLFDPRTPTVTEAAQASGITGRSVAPTSIPN